MRFTTRSSVSPHECSLLVCVPVTESTFRASLQSTRSCDFSASVLRRNPGISISGAWKLYALAASTMRAACNEASSRGVHVSMGATLSDIEYCCAKYQVVSLVAHLREEPVTKEDIVEPSAFARQAATGNASSPSRAAIIRAIQSVLADADHPGRLGGGRSPTAEAVARAINVVIADGSSERVAATDPAQVGTSELRPHFSRMDIEDLFPGIVAQARAVELGDGLRCAGEVIAAIPPRWRGVLDLTLCQSSPLGRSIRRHRGNCTVIVNPGLATLEFRAMRYRLVMSELARAPEPFLEVVKRVHLAILEATDGC